MGIRFLLYMIAVCISLIIIEKRDSHLVWHVSLLLDKFLYVLHGPVLIFHEVFLGQIGLTEEAFRSSSLHVWQHILVFQMGRSIHGFRLFFHPRTWGFGLWLVFLVICVFWLLNVNTFPSVLFSWLLLSEKINVVLRVLFLPPCWILLLIS